MDYAPDKWVVIKIVATENGDTHYRVFATWYGGYTGSDSWKMNSGITRVEKTDDGYALFGESGSVYLCHQNCWGLSGYGSSVLKSFETNTDVTISMLPQETDLTTVEYVTSKNYRT